MRKTIGEQNPAIDLTAQAAYFSMSSWITLQAQGTTVLPRWEQLLDEHDREGFRNSVKFIAAVENASKSSRPPSPESVWGLWTGTIDWKETNEHDRKATDVFIAAALVIMRALDRE